MNNQTSKLIFNMRICRKLLHMNPKIPAKYCRYCGKLLSEHCDCKQPFEVIDIKPLRDHPESTVIVFANTPEFQKELNILLSTKKDNGNEVEAEIQ